MPSFYNDGQYGVLERHYFHAAQETLRLNGDRTLVKRFYPKGPIVIQRFGVQHRATQGGTEVTISLYRNSSQLATVVASTDSAPWAIASKSSLDKTVDAGSYLAITSAGTVATGSVICFMDYRRKYASNWDTD